MRTSPPLRFVGTLLGGWICLRAAMFAPAWFAETGDLRSTNWEGRRVRAEPAPVAPSIEMTLPSPPADVPSCRSCGRQPQLVSVSWSEMSPSSGASLVPIGEGAASGTGEQLAQVSSEALPSVRREGLQPVATAQAGPSPIPQPLRGPAIVGRWSATVWAFVRQGDASQLAPGGTLGGSQAGARFSYRLNGDPARPLALSGRLHAPMKNRRAAEAAIGVAWKPLPRAPMQLLAERRQALGRDGRSAFSLLAYGGVSSFRLGGPLKLDAYAQAGIVGLRSRDLFADGSAMFGIPLDNAGTFMLGVGVWGAAQPGASRLDAGPSLSYRLPLQARNIRLSADWRLRLAGEALPNSGPALTLASDF